MRKQWPLLVVVLCSVAAALAGCDKNSPTEPSPGPCTFTLSVTSLSMGASGGPGSVNVTTGSHCTWSAASDRGWMSIASGANGTGNGVVNVSLTANSSETTRTGTLTVAGQGVAIVQEGLGTCTVELSPSSASLDQDAANGTFTVTAPAHCQWSATSDSAWLAAMDANQHVSAEEAARAQNIIWFDEAVPAEVW